jgi:flagellar basal-body rod modification protein FlgD
MEELLGTTQLNNTQTNSALNAASQETNPSKAEIGEQKLAEDFQTFLLLLTTQLENQDPTEPLDTNEFTNQLVQFASVEQQLATNTNLEQLISMTEQARVDTGVSYIGKAVDAPGNTGFLTGGQAAFVYELPRDAASVTVSVLDSTGRAVFSGQGATGKGKNLVTWDGIGNVGAADGEQLPDGVYAIGVAARDAAGEPIESTTYTSGRVTAATFGDDGEMQLELGGQLKVGLDDVKAVREIF